ncbi:cutinase family protein [Corynebacterium meitnerae]|uniref:Cutinase family protein n=1 Tax=Corynebacterium meitnerae TaxID=2913498 RepID=A0A9X3LRK6_9CORY|nr:cutinase family protein [Corynebacterium meitnerae]MCZ9292905.1 cutinase family protein [Corynebacterium meitnerae]
MLRRKIAAAAIAVATAFGSTFAITPEAQAQDVAALIASPNVTKCSEEFLIAVPGGGTTFSFLPEKAPVGAKVTEVATDVYYRTGGRIQPVWIAYPSVPFLVMSYKDSSAKGYEKAASTMRRLANMCPNAKFSITGYSEGADIGAQLINNISHGRGPIPAEKFTKAALISNPRLGDNGGVFAMGATAEHRGGLETPPGGYGELGSRTMDLCFVDDSVCALPEEWRAHVSPVVRSATFRGEFALSHFVSIIMQTAPHTLPDLVGLYNHTQYGTPAFNTAVNWILQREVRED